MKWACASTSVKGDGQFEFELRHAWGPNVWWSSERGGQPQFCDSADGQWFEQLLLSYERRMGSEVQIFIPIRDAYTHLRSLLRHTSKPFAEFNDSAWLWNPCSKELGLHHASQVQRFLKEWPFQRAKRLHVLLAEDLSASLVMFRRTVNWSLRDVVSFSTHVTSEKQAAQVLVPAAEDIPSDRLNLDQQLYLRLQSWFADELQLHRSQNSDFEREVLAHKRITKAVARVCGGMNEHLGGSFLAQFCRSARAEADLESLDRLQCVEK